MIDRRKLLTGVKISSVIFSVLIIATVLSLIDHRVYADTSSVTKTPKLVTVNIKSLFTIKAPENDFRLENGKRIWNNLLLEKNPANSKIYDEIKPSKELREKTIVIFPVFTAAAYGQNGFYYYYGGKCDQTCLHVQLQTKYPSRYEASGNAVQTLKLLGYNFITDIDVDKDPQILKKYHKVIVLHSEYVTKREFNAITKHPNVVYLYPNALYAEVSVDYKKNQISLVRGHGYPDSTIKNGFDWKFDNTDVEHNTECSKMGFDKISNGWMLNCYPEYPIHASKVLLKIMRDI